MTFRLLGMGLILNDSFDMVPPPPRGFPTCSEFDYIPEELDPNTSPIPTTTTTSVTLTPDKVTEAPCPTADCDEGNLISFAVFYFTVSAK